MCYIISQFGPPFVKIVEETPVLCEGAGKTSPFSSACKKFYLAASARGQNMVYGKGQFSG